jgi:copper chaperone CopZ
MQVFEITMNFTSSPRPMTTYTYYIHQMHCASCKILVAEVLTDLNLKNSTIDLKTKQITFQTNLLPADFLTSLTAKLAEYSYSLSDSSSIKSESLTTPFLTALFFVITFLLLDKLGLSKLLNPSQITLPVVFVIGILASLSTCMALVGGLLLGLSQTKGSHLLFHLSRLLKEEGLEEIPTAVGDAYNHAAHEAVETIEDKEDGKILAVLQKGYKFQGGLFRPARVKVSRRGPEPRPEKSPDDAPAI